jgi:hypothetical protein
LLDLGSSGLVLPERVLAVVAVVAGEDEGEAVAGRSP